VKVHRFVRRRGPTDGGQAVSLTRRPPFSPRKIPERLSQPQGHSAAGRIRSIKKSNDLIGNQIRDLPAYSIVPQPTTLPRAPYMHILFELNICNFLCYVSSRINFLNKSFCASQSPHIRQKKRTHELLYDILFGLKCTNCQSESVDEIVQVVTIQ
jgi:hypothetical protein